MQLVALFKPWTWMEMLFLEYFIECVLCKKKWKNAVGTVLFKGERKTKKNYFLYKKKTQQKRKNRGLNMAVVESRAQRKTLKISKI